ncbi:MAG: DinB family protein [Bacteroidota bacterium]|jgi:hypothetical protein
MKTLNQLIHEVEQARSAFIQSVSGLSFEQVNFKPAADVWSVLQNTEHIVRAEQSGVSGIFKALDGIANHRPVWEGIPVHQGLSIEEIVDKTWQTKEQVPEIAAPIWGGSIDYWIAMLKSQSILLAELGKLLEGRNLEEIIYPHPISGPLNIYQRIEFLRFHLNRHQSQVERLNVR